MIDNILKTIELQHLFIVIGEIVKSSASIL
jgi:hypothetical protein